MTKFFFNSYLLLTLPFLYFLSAPIATGDLAVWVAHGKYFLETGSVLKHDIFSMLLTKELVYPFGTTLIYGIIFKIFGIIGVSFFHKLIPILISSIFLWIIRKNKIIFGTHLFLYLILSFVGISFFFVERPALLAIVPFLLSYLVLQKVNFTSKDYIVLILLNIVWANLHGSFIMLSIMYFYRELIDQILKRAFNVRKIIFGIMLFLSSLLNPFGHKIFLYILETAKISMQRGLDEWGKTIPVGPYWLQACSFYLIVLLIIFLLAKKLRWSDFIKDPIAIFVLMGIMTIRNTIWLHLAFIPFLIKQNYFTADPIATKEVRKSLNAFISGIILLLIVLFSPWVKPNIAAILPIEKREVFSESTPIKFADEIRKNYPGKNIFNDWDYGSYFILVLENKIFIDTRNIIYFDENFKDYVNIMNGANDWENILNKYKCEMVVIRKKNAKNLIAKILQSKNWKLIKENSDGIMFEKRA